MRVGCTIIVVLLTCFVFIFYSFSSHDDDTDLEFYWDPAWGNVNHYNIYVAIVDSSDTIDPNNFSNYSLAGAYLRTDSQAIPTKITPYLLPLVGQNNKIYYVVVSAEDTVGEVLLTLGTELEDDLDSGSITSELLQAFADVEVLLSADATVQGTARDQYLFSVAEGGVYITDLDSAVVSDALRQLFTAHGHTLSGSAAISIVSLGERWEIADGDAVYAISAVNFASPSATIWLIVGGPPKGKFWVIADVDNQVTYSVAKATDGTMRVVDGRTGINSSPSDYVWCMLEQAFVPGQPKQTRGFGD